MKNLTIIFSIVSTLIIFYYTNIVNNIGPNIVSNAEQFVKGGEYFKKAGGLFKNFLRKFNPVSYGIYARKLNPPKNSHKTTKSIKVLANKRLKELGIND